MHPPPVQAEHELNDEHDWLPLPPQRLMMVCKPSEVATPAKLTSSCVAVAMMGTVGTMVLLLLTVAPTNDAEEPAGIVKANPLKADEVQPGPRM